MNDPVERFSDRVANYVKYRPGYPREVIAYLEKACGLTHETVVADVGCGTGISSRLFLENCNHVIGIEPNAAMRAAAADLLAEFPEFELRDGTSSATTLADGSVDMIVAAQAFHWFDPPASRREFERVLRPGGYITLIWNERQLDTTPFLVAYEELLLKYGRDYSEVRHENIEERGLREFFGGDYQSAVFENVQVFDLDGIRGRMLSSSYIPDESDPAFPAMNEELQVLFAKHAENGRIRVLYDTKVFTCKV